MDEYRLARLLDRKIGPFPVRAWVIFGSLAYWAASAAFQASAPLREGDRIAQRARSWRGMAEELAEALTEPLADRLAGALARRGTFIVSAPEDVVRG